MSEDRTQPPSKRRRQLARERGQVAHSPELTSAAGWLAAVIALGAFGRELTTSLVQLVAGSLAERPLINAEPGAVVAHLRGMMLALACPLGLIVAAFALGAFVAHQAQVRGLWTPARVMPDVARLWSFSAAHGLGMQAERTTWALARSIILIVATLSTIRASWPRILGLGALDGPALAHAAGELVSQLGRVLAGLMLVLGLVDYALRHRRFEAMLRTTPEQQREDRRIVEGDVSLRAQRRQIARGWRTDSPELLAGAVLVLEGPGGLTVVLGGGPPPARITIRAVASGNQGARLRRSAQSLKMTHVDSPRLAHRMARLASSRSAIPAEVVAELTAIWPIPETRQPVEERSIARHQ